MVISYDNRKKSYDSMDDSQKQQYNDMLKNKGDDYVGNQYMKQYNQQTNNTPQSDNNSSNFNNQNGTNWGNQAYKWNPWEVDQKVENQTDSNGYSQTKDGFYTWNSEWEKEQNRKKLAEMEWNVNAETKQTDFNNVSPDLDQSKFNQDPWKITVQEWTAQQTWLPDYQASSEARLNEMKGNLDHYFATSPRMFSDRETFNRVFEYNNRDSEAQRQLLDSYWKRKEDMDKASQYTSWESIMNWLNNSEITTDQLNLIKDTDPEAYRKWQELQEEEIKKRIVNDIVPPLLEEISQNMINMMNNLWLQPQEAEDIEWVYNDTMDRTQAWQTMEDANRTVKRIEEVNNKRTAIMNRYAASTWWTVSDALAAARMQKALAPYDTEMQGLQYQYQDYANLFSQKQAAAYQAAQVRQMQASENQRIWNQRYQALWFAQTAMSYRTPEQQAQLRLQEQQAKNEMELLQESRLKDLARYDAYATAKMKNQLQQELTDLSVEDENQLKANLNNALSDYYKNYGNIIQRSQAQAVDDIIAYAKKKGISVAQAMTENFIKPLQNKPEYKQKIASDYGMIAKQSIATVNWKSVIMTTNPNWSISYQFIEDPEKATSTAKPYDLVDEKVFDTSPQSHSYYTLADFINDPTNKEWTYWGQCAKFVNDYLEKIWVGRYFWNEDIKTRASRCNSDVAKVWTIAVFDYNHNSSDWINHGHVGIVVDTDDKWYWVLESNYDVKNPEKIQRRYVLNGSTSLKWFFDPSKPASAISSGENETFEWGWNTYNLGSYSWWNDLTETEKNTVINLLTYQTDPASLPKSWKDNWASNQKIRAAAASIGRDYGYSERKYSLVKNAEKLWDDKSLKWDISRNATSVSILKNLADSYWDLNNWDIQKVNQWINNIKTQFWDAVTLSTAANMTVAAEEIAWALKWGASPSEKDTQNILDLFNGNLSNAQAQDLFRTFAKDLLDKNMTEAQRFRQTTWYKPYSIYTDEVSDRVYNDMGLTDLAKYYDYTPVNAYTSWPQDQIYDLWKDDFEDSYWVSYNDAYYLVNG